MENSACFYSFPVLMKDLWSEALTLLGRSCLTCWEFLTFSVFNCKKGVEVSSKQYIVKIRLKLKAINEVKMLFEMRVLSGGGVDSKGTELLLELCKAWMRPYLGHCVQDLVTTLQAGCESSRQGAEQVWGCCQGRWGIVVVSLLGVVFGVKKTAAKVELKFTK